MTPRAKDVAAKDVAAYDKAVATGQVHFELWFRAQFGPPPKKTLWDAATDISAASARLERARAAAREAQDYQMQRSAALKAWSVK